MLKVTCMLILMLTVSEFAYSKNLTPDQATSYLKSLNCEFSAFLIYKGKTFNTMYGALINGSANDTGICISTYEENNAFKNKYCWLRPTNMSTGKYVGSQSKGHYFRKEGTNCSKETIIALLKQGSIRSELNLKATNHDWKIVDDVFSLGDEFFNVLKGPSKEAYLKKLKYGNYKWRYYSASKKCAEDIGGADDSTVKSFSKYEILAKTNTKLVVDVSSNTEHSYFYTTKDECDNDKRSNP